MMKLLGRLLYYSYEYKLEINALLMQLKTILSEKRRVDQFIFL